VVKSDVPVVLFDPALNGTPGMSNVDLAMFIGDAVYTGVFKPRSSLTG
jgi:hypothetical protein